MTPTSVRVRFAPSPTGWLHAGGVRTALFNWLFARRHGGEFLLRIENTDTTREVHRATAQIQRSLRQLGLTWDGEVSFQLDNAGRCRELAQRLVAEGKAYEDHDPDKGTAVKLRMPSAGTTVWDDAVKGRIEVPNDTLKDLVLLRADGRPTYNFASPVDDALDGITHVIRGDDHVSNTPKQIHVLRALGYEPPVYAHIPMVAGPDGKKWSKRHGAVSVEDFLDQGYLPEALVNMLALTGWAPGDGETQEMFTLDGLTRRFTLAGIGEAMGRFDYAKLDWMNGQYLRALAPDEFGMRLHEWLSDAGYRWWDHLIDRVAPLVQDKIATFGEFPAFAGYFFARPAPAVDLIGDGALLTAFRDTLELDDVDWRDAERIGELLKQVCADQGVKPREGFRALYGAITGSKIGASIFHSLTVLGRDETLTRLEKAIRAAEDAARSEA